MITVDLVIQVLFSSLLVGLAYGLMSLGFTLTFGVMNIANYAHGALYMLGGYITYTFSLVLNLPMWSSLIVTMFGMFLAGLAVELLAVETVKADPNSSMLITVGVAILLEQLSLLIWGGRFRTVPALIPGTILISANSISLPQVFSAVIALAIAAGLFIFLTRTKQGKAIRIVAFDREIAVTLGISVSSIGLLTFGIGSLTAGVAGGLMSSLYPLYPSVGWPIVVIAVIVVIVGGVGSIKGTMIAGIVYAVAQNVAGVFFPRLTSIVGLLLLMVILLVRPGGFFGHEYVERV